MFVYDVRTTILPGLVDKLIVVILESKADIVLLMKSRNLVNLSFQILSTVSKMEF